MPIAILKPPPAGDSFSAVATPAPLDPNAWKKEVIKIIDKELDGGGGAGNRDKSGRDPIGKTNRNG